MVLVTYPATYLTSLRKQPYPVLPLSTLYDNICPTILNLKNNNHLLISTTQIWLFLGIKSKKKSYSKNLNAKICKCHFILLKIKNCFTHKMFVALFPPFTYAQYLLSRSTIFMLSFEANLSKSILKPKHCISYYTSILIF